MGRIKTKTATLTLRVPPEVKDLLAAAVGADCRSLANMFEVIVLAYCDKHGISVSATPHTQGRAQ